MHLIFYNKNNFNKGENTKLYYFNVKINGLGISIIGDNEKKNKNLQKYNRKEILFFYFKNINLSIDRKIEGGIIKIALINTDFNIEKIRLYNQSIENAKYHLIMENNNNFCSLQTNILYYYIDKVSVINNIKLALDKIKLSLDPSFIIQIIDFISNIIYRMNIRDFNVDNIFLNPDKIKEDNIFEDYKNKSTIYYGNNISIPSLDISFEMSNIGLDNLLKQYLNYSSFYSWIIKSLTGNKYNIKASGNNVQKFVGNVKQLIITILNKYKDSVFKEFIKIAFQGIVLGIIKIFSKNNHSNNNNNNNISRFRPPRAFYGKYKFFKNFNRDDANILDKLKNKYDFFKNESYYFCNYIKGNKYIYIFTNLSIYIMDNNLNILFNVDYFTILDIKIENDNLIKVYFNQDIDNSNFCIITCEGKVITYQLYNILWEQLRFNSDEMLFIN